MYASLAATSHRRRKMVFRPPLQADRGSGIVDFAVVATSLRFMTCFRDEGLPIGVSITVVILAAVLDFVWASARWVLKRLAPADRVSFQKRRGYHRSNCCKHSFYRK